MTASTKAGLLSSVTLLMAVDFFLMSRKGLTVPCIILVAVWLCHLVYFLFGVKTLKAGGAGATDALEEAPESYTHSPGRSN